MRKRKTAKSEYQKAIKKLDIVFAKMIRERDEPKGCITSGRKGVPLDAGHFRFRSLMPTRWHPYNVNGQAIKDNRFMGGRTFEYGLAIDKRYGTGWALFLEKLSHDYAGWSMDDIAYLMDAARRGSRVYEQAYFQLKPEHRLSPSL
jgi:hypothetical protein